VEKAALPLASATDGACAAPSTEKVTVPLGVAVK
jgi:hypothetical protein